MTQDDIIAKLTITFRDIFRDSRIVLTPESTPDTIAGWDSFKYVSILVALEAAYTIELDGPELDHVQNVGELVDLIQSKAMKSASLANPTDSTSQHPSANAGN